MGKMGTGRLWKRTGKGMGPDMRLMAILAIMTATMTSPSSQGNPWLASGRCGSQNLLPDGQPGQCDPNGWGNEVGPCCSNWGWCGNTAGHCDCAECTDYRVGAVQLIVAVPSVPEKA